MTAEWSLWRYRHAVEMIRRRARPGCRLLDVGCGRGNVLRHLAEESGVDLVAGLEPDVEVAREARRSGHEVIEGSILDPTVVEQVGRGWDFVVLGDVLHHLVGDSVTESRRRATEAMQMAASLVAPEGCLLVLEPCYRSRLATTAVFHLKRRIARIRRQRLELGAEWLNLGPPVVLFSTPEALDLLVAAAPSLTVEERVVSDSGALAGILARCRLTIIARRTESEGSSGRRPS